MHCDVANVAESDEGQVLCLEGQSTPDQQLTSPFYAWLTGDHKKPAAGTAC